MSRFAVIFLVIVTPILALCLALLGLATIPTNPVGWSLLLTGTVYSAGVVFVALIRRERIWKAQEDEEVVREERGDRSFWLITLAMIAVFFLSPLEYICFAAWLPRTILTKACGVGLVVIGSVLFVWSRRTLGASYSGHVSVQKGQELVQSGPYRFIRHPAYAGYLWMALGISVGYSSLAGLISVFALLLPSLVYRMNVEERVQKEHYGEAYHRYASRVNRFIPGIW